MKQEIGLSKQYILVQDSGTTSTGGNQEWLSDKTGKLYGCGLIAVTDLLHYITEESWKEKYKYLEFVQDLRKRYVRLFYLGLTGWGVSRGLNRYFRSHHMQYQAKWSVPKSKLKNAIRNMLERDLPVILSVGPNWPRIWGKQGVPIYRKNARGELVKAQDIRAHYVTVIGMKDDVMKLISWGKVYYMRWDEYKAYLKNDSCGLFTNICYISQVHEV